MREICFATNNTHKLEEVWHLLKPDFRILSLSDIGCFEDLPETRNTLEGNALQKAEFVFEHYKMPCFADDSGLEVYALNNAPGVYSARYAGPQRNNAENIDLLLKNLEGEKERRARFRCVIALTGYGTTKIFEGSVEGQILKERKGNMGFGYDPVFRPDHHTLTFAEMPLEEKNKMSHRAMAVAKLVEYLKTTAGGL